MLSDEDKQWISHELERVESRLVAEFHKWASPFEALADQVRNVDERLKRVEQR